MIPCVLFEDAHLLVVDKPAGVNTHAPSPYAGEGIYDWLRHREPRWASLAIIHRLDKETSGVMVFAKTPAANRSLTEQFTRREVRKKYQLLTDRPVKRDTFTIKSSLARIGEKYASRSMGEPAETHFHVVESGSRHTLLEAEPRTGRTHQIRVHAAESGFPILGDSLYGGTPAERVFLHATELSFKHPETSRTLELRSPVDLAARHLSPQPSTTRGGIMERRLALIDTAETNAFRLSHGASDGWPGWQVDRLGAFLLSQSEHPLTPPQVALLREWLTLSGARGVYHKVLNRQVRRATTSEASAQLMLGEAAPDRFEILENGVRYELRFNEGYSVGLFLDQRDNRRRFLTGHVAAGFSLIGSPAPLPVETTSSPQPPAFRGQGSQSSGEHSSRLKEWSRPGYEVLNTFAYTCGFSVCAALGGARVTSLDLSKKYLDWGKRNFVLNGLEPTRHDFLYGDTFDWLRRLAKKGRAFDAIVLDPPTFSQSKTGGLFRAEKDYARLVSISLPLLKPDGVLLASTNAADWPPQEFVEAVKEAAHSCGRPLAQTHYAPQPLDFPITRAEPGYLKTVWLRV
jgi:23S rRNA (cytosine1962-C5)-methyltransferase